MVGIPQYEQQLQARRQALEDVQKQIKSFSPKVRQTQEQLRTATPTSQLAIKRTVASRQKAKLQALKQIQGEFKKQEQLEKKFTPIQQQYQQYQEALKKQQEFEYGQKLGFKGVVDPKMSKMAREGYLSSKAALKSYEQRKSFIEKFEGAIQKWEAEHPTEQLIVGKTGVTGIKSGALSTTFPSIEEYSLALGIEPMTKIPELEEVSYTKTPLPEVKEITMPTLGAKMRGQIKQVVGVSIPSAKQLKETFGWREIKKIPEYVPAAAAVTYEKVGVPVVTEEVAVPERRFFERGTKAFEPKTGKFVLPESKPFPTAPKFEVEILSPAKLGRITTLPVYAVPQVGAGLIVLGPIRKGIEMYKQPSATELQRKKGLGMATLGVTTLVVPPAFLGGRGIIRAAKKPFKVTVTAPEQTFFAAKATTTGEVTTGVAKRMTVYPEAVAEIPTYKVWKARATTGKIKIPKDAFKIKADVDVTIQPFRIIDEKGVSIGATRKLGPSKTLTKLEQTFEIQKPTEILDFSKLPKEWNYMARKLPPRDVKGISTFVGVGQTYKGVGKAIGPQVSVGKELIADVPFRLTRYSKKQAQIFAPTKRMEAPFTKSISRVKQVGVLPEGSQVFGVEAVAKVTKKPMGIAKGKVYPDKGIVFIKQISEKADVTYVGKATTKQITKQKQLAARIQQLVPPKARPPKRVPKTKVVAPETYVVAPVIARSVGRKASLYYGKGMYELTETSTSVLAPVFKPVSVQTPLVYTKGQERIKFVELGAIDTKVREGIIEIDVAKEKEGLVVVSRLAQPTKPVQKAVIKPIEKEALVPKTALTVKQVQKPKPKFPGRPKRPTPQPRPIPRKPKRPVIPKLKTDFAPKKKIKERVVKKDLLIPFIKRRGKYFAVGPAVAREKAIKKGIAKLRKTLAASLQLRKPSGAIVKFAKETKEFRLGEAGKSPFVLVQKAPRRLSMREEVAEIIASRKAGAVKFT